MNYDKLIKEGLKQGFSDLEIYSSTQTRTNILVFQKEVEKNEISNMTTYTLRGIYNGKMAYLYSENLKQSAKKTIEQLKNNALVLTSKEESEIFAGSKKYKQVKKNLKGFDLITFKEKINILLEIESKIKEADKRIIHIPYCSYDESKKEVTIVNSKGLNVHKSYEFASLAVQVVAKEAKQTQSYFDVDIQKDFSAFKIDEFCNKIVTRVIDMLDASQVDSGEYDVIFENKAMIDILGAFSSVFSGEAAMEKMNLLVDKVGQIIMDKKISIVEDPFYEKAIIVNPFDDEGVATYKKDIVKNGKLETLLHNLKTAKYFKTETTGNGMRKGSGTGIGSTNTYIVPQQKSLEELIKETKNGLLITKVAGLHSGVNDISGDFSIQSSGFQIVNGEIKKAVNLIVVSGNFFKIMKNVLDVASDLKFSYNFGSPSIKFKSLQVSGK